jgi:hypothetical protein
MCQRGSHFALDLCLFLVLLLCLGRLGMELGALYAREAAALAAALASALAAEPAAAGPGGGGGGGGAPVPAFAAAPWLPGLRFHSPNMASSLCAIGGLYALILGIAVLSAWSLLLHL